MNSEAVISVFRTISKEKDLQVCVTESLTGGLIAGSSNVINGLLGGPIGMAIGGLVGGLTAAKASKDFKPVGVVIMNMTPCQKEELIQNLQQAVQDLDVTGLIFLATLLNTDAAVKEIGLNVLRRYLTSNMGLSKTCKLILCDTFFFFV